MNNEKQAATGYFVATDGAAYENFMGRWSSRLAPLFLEFAGIKAGDRVLDVGCGTGVMTHGAAMLGANAVGFDMSEQYLDYARIHRSHPNARYDQGDARSLPYPDSSFDVAVSTLAIDVVPYAEEIVTEMRRIVRSGGIIASALHEYRSAFAPSFMLLDIASVLDERGRALRDYMLSHPLVWPDGQASLWRKLNLSDVREAPLVVSYDYTSFDDYWETWLAGQGRVGSYVISLSEDARVMLREHVRGAYLGGRPDGPRSFSVIHRAVRGIVPSPT
jgi:SAM-dependent methyltransferase